MAEQILDYWLRYDIPSNEVGFWIRTASGWDLAKKLPPQDAVFLSDMLRNEKPLYYGKGQYINTREEPPGEAE